MADEATGLVAVLAECGAQVPLQEFHDWYTEHALSRFTVPGFLTATRYQAVDEQTPAWVTLYDLISPAVASEETYSQLRDKASDREKVILPLLQSIDRRTYELIGTFYPASSPPAATFPTKYLLFVALEVTPEHEDDFNKWYVEEHMPMLEKVPGWMRGRRYKIVDTFARGDATGKKVPKYLAIHEFTSNEYWGSEEYKQATSTPWRNKVMKNLVAREVRRWELLKAFERPT